MTVARRLLLLAPAAVLAATLLLPAGWESPVPLCAVKALTGLDCPGCGMTRAFLLLGHGRIAGAVAMHPASVPAYLVLAGLALTGIARVIHDDTRLKEGRACTARCAEERSHPTR